MSEYFLLMFDDVYQIGRFMNNTEIETRLKTTDKQLFEWHLCLCVVFFVFWLVCLYSRYLKSTLGNIHLIVRFMKSEEGEAGCKSRDYRLFEFWMEYFCETAKSESKEDVLFPVSLSKHVFNFGSSTTWDKYYTPQVLPDWGSNAWPSDHDSTLHVTETPDLFYTVL